MQVQDQLTQTYRQHVAQLQSHVQHILQTEPVDGLVIHSGQTKRYFLDDQDYPFKANPHFKAWLPVNVANCWLIVNGTDKPTLIYYQPDDFWHKTDTLEDDYWTDFYDIHVLTQANQVEKLLPRIVDRYAYIGEHIEVAKALGFEQINPEPVLNYFHYHRAYKSDYEVTCIKLATEKAVKCHLAAKQAFLNGLSELDVHYAYLAAGQMVEQDLPYPNIIAFNQNAATLHYTQHERLAPSAPLSLLIDAGAMFNGYAADITRTYSYKNNEFQQVINRLAAIQQQLIDLVKPNLSFGDLHHQCHVKIAELLVELDIVTLSAKDSLQQGITNSFFPHGLGHHLGLQVHDVGGFMADDRGTHMPAPQDHPFLRTTRKLENKMLVTIEPGLYFIESLLNKLKQSDQGKYINWDRVDNFIPFGGIRIEDNVLVQTTSTINLTRQAGLA
ncbi:Xaa-Pro dipeptidase [Saccharobesus litoralis]|uniref:Xaa-Pro dipeptidase n=1 Tax=Saccharobesus litoralis TaxID=2172099 RepID=A0A2S0VR43_9ALTE|nr:Xaa-Pro dipeptidase [Saccharobesus litoralis]AWB66550.1 Xaa-Pro dipeptidase [Saccharobesus litoralis]